MTRRCIVGVVALTLACPGARWAAAADELPDWASVLAQLPPSEKPIELFNGKDLTGWDGAEGYWSAVDGRIRGANDKPVASSTYLFTRTSHRDFRLLFDVKQTLSPKHSTMHSAVAALGEVIADKGDNQHGFRGPLLMFCHDWGIWDAHRRNRVVPVGVGPKVERKGEWNRVEILARGERLRFVANGALVFDFTDKAEMLKKSPIGLQLHSNNQPQEYHFRGLVLTEDPEDKLITLRE